VNLQGEDWYGSFISVIKDNSGHGEADFILLETWEDGTINSLEVITFETLSVM
jgi:hypothetical protein